MGAVETGIQRIEDLSFEPPGPGSWEIDRTHAPYPCTRFTTEVHSDPLERGFREAFRRYGLLLEGLQWRLINGFAYRTVVPAPEEEIPERFAAAERAFEMRLWREDVREWDEEAKPRSIAAHLALQEVDPATLDDEQLVEHLAACREHCDRMIEQHHRYNVAALLPTGDLLVQGSEITGVSPGELLMLLKGSAPASGAAADGLDELAAAIRDDGAARALLFGGGDPAETLAALRDHEGEVGEAASAYLRMVGWRLLDGLDVGYPCALERPEMVLEAIRIAVETEGDVADVPVDLEAIRGRLPDEERRRFDSLLEEARHTYRLRDERGIYSEVWAYGLTRRALLAAGARLAAAGRIENPEHAVEAGPDEIATLLRGDGGPAAGELAARAGFRAAYTAKDAPSLLGPEPPEPPSLDGLPPAPARAMAAIGTAIGMLFGDAEGEHGPDVVRGLAASPGSYEGTARVLEGPSQLERLRQGDVLVTGSTTEAFNIVLPLVGAIVTDSGGLLSHAAIVAREFGVPGVVGTREATRLISDGARVRVDGESGEVHLLG